MKQWHWGLGLPRVTKQRVLYWEVEGGLGSWVWGRVAAKPLGGLRVQGLGLGPGVWI